MDELQKDFLNQAISDLTEATKKLNAEDVSENVLRDAFRRLHTIKGTAQVFGFAGIGNLAHEIENLLQAGRDKKIPTDKNFYTLLGEGLNYLTEIVRQTQANEKASTPKLFVEKLRLIAKNDASVEGFSLYLPREILTQLSTAERDSITAAIKSGKNLFLIETGFPAANLEIEFKNFRNVLDGAGEVAAFFPSFNPTFRLAQDIGFRVFLITEKSSAEISQIVLPFAGEISLKVERDKTIFGNFRKLVFSQVINDAKKLAEKSGKKIDFNVSLTEAEIPVKRLKILFGALLHLTRNAIDHGIEKRGKITIRLVSEKSGLHLTVSDDGRGIDIDKVRAKAIEKNLIAANARLSENKTLNLIFAHGFSTSEEISETSGRGVGLDAVKDSVERASGKITVISKKKAGTTFEIFLPIETISSEL